VIRNTRVKPLLLTVVVLSVLAVATDAHCRLNLPEMRQETRITNEDHRNLRQFFSRIDHDNPHKTLDDRILGVLVHALPEAFKRGCTEIVSKWNSSAGGSASISMRLLFVEGRRESGPIRALLSFSCSSRDGSRPGLRDERLVSLIVDKDFSTLTTLADEKDCESCSDLLHIVLEKEVRIGGHTLVGLNFVRSNGNAPWPTTSDLLREERVRFYLFDDTGVNPAGSVVKAREERVPDTDKGYVTMTYSAGLVFKKDMKGNIVGILSPYTAKTSDGKNEKGMVRFAWDADRKEFVKNNR
jgi:hypothetical protein